ncbi:hypothetical protein CPS_2631 [Colwellia psychrerythraea 34H]|uniref:Uncharacterized protein n=1 Tax=Colwellia psychrerythraea (strain 34H / ATCC BAA-681) TaxID=167879 RepID=Q481C4_COLP3|nr:hypothetical protein CPS_2631 [Colwellia psychrerythraea 34H]
MLNYLLNAGPNITVRAFLLRANSKKQTKHLSEHH